MQELINRTSSIAEAAVDSAMDAAYLASFFGLTYIAMTVLTSLVARLRPVRTTSRSML